MKNKKSLQKAILRAFGEDADNTRLWVSIVRGTTDDVLNILGEIDERSVQKKWSWSKIFKGGKARSPLTEALEEERIDLIKPLVKAGAKWEAYETQLAAALVVNYAQRSPQSSDLAPLVAACLNTNIDWRVGMFYEQKGERLEKYGTPRIFLMDHLEEQAFALGLFKTTKPEKRLLRSKDDKKLDLVVEEKVAIDKNILPRSRPL